MFLASLIAMVVLGVTPQATLNVVGPTTVEAGSVVLLDGTKSVYDLPLVWSSSPSDGVLLWEFDQAGKHDVIAAFSAVKPGSYDVILVACGWTDASKTEIVVSAATKTIVVGEPLPPVPPTPPTPTDPMALAAVKYHQGLDAVYSAAYA